MLFDRISDASLTRLRVLGRESVVVVALYCLGYDKCDQETEDGEAEDDTTLMNKQKKLSESRKYHIYYILKLNSSVSLFPVEDLNFFDE